MSNFKKSILICGAFILCIAVALGTFLVLSSLKMFTPDPIAVEFTVVDGEKVYDGKPLSADWYYITKGELLQGHRAVVSYEGEITDVGEAKSDMSVRIKDAKGVDVTDSYAIKVVGGTLKVTVSELSVKIPDMETVYNGRFVEVDTFELLGGTLGVGHTLMLDVPGGINAGDRLVFNEENLKVYDAVGRDVTYNYQITCASSNFMILERPLTVSPLSVPGKMYDGTALSVGRYEITSGSLAPDQYIEAAVSVVRRIGNNVIAVEKGVTAITAFGSYELRIDEDDFKIFDKEGNEVTENYSIDFQTESVEIEKRPITVAVQSLRHVYNGETVSPAVTVTYGTLASYHTLSAGPLLLSVKETGAPALELRRVGEYEARVNDNALQILDRSGTDVRENYDVLYETGSVTVEKCPITIAVHSISKDYDALGSTPSCEVVSGTVAPSQAIRFNGILYTAKNDATGESIPLTATESKVFNAGTYTVTVDASSVKIFAENAEDGEDDADDANETGNYDLHFTSGTYEVRKLALTVYGQSKQFTYDGEKHSFALPDGEEYEVFDDDEGLKARKHKVHLSYTGTASVEKVGDIADNAFTCKVWQSGVEGESDALEVSVNYTVTLVYGKLTVAALGVKVNLKDFDDIYTGERFKFDDAVKQAGLLETFEVQGEVSDDCEAQVRAALVLQSDSGERVQDVGEYLITAVLSGKWAENCNLTVRRSTLTITPKTVYLKQTAQPTLVYGNTPTVDFSILGVHDGRGGELGVSVTYAVVTEVRYDYTDATKATVYLREPTVEDATGKNVTKNYTLKGLENGVDSAAFVTYTVEKRPVILKFRGTAINEERVTLFMNGGWKQYFEVDSTTPLVAGDTIDLSVTWGNHNFRYDYGGGTLYIRKSDVHIANKAARMDDWYAFSGNIMDFTFAPEIEGTLPVSVPAFRGDFPVLPAL